MTGSKIILDDWNTVFRKIPETINGRTHEIMEASNNCVDFDNYLVLKSRLAVVMKDVGCFDYINHATGDQAIINAIALSKKYTGLKNIYIVKDAFHGITMKLFRDGVFDFNDISISEIALDDLEKTIGSCGENSMLILEPFLFFARFGAPGIDIIRSAVKMANNRRVLVLLDEIRSGVFCTGQFLFLQKCMPLDVTFICFSKGLALGIPTSVLAIKEGFFSKEIIKKEDRLKSCMSTSEVAMQRSNDLLQYYLNDSVSFDKRLHALTKKIVEHMVPFEKYQIIKQVNVMGMCCVFVFNGNIKKSIHRLLWTYLISKGIETRHAEDDLWFLNFALDSTSEEINKVRIAIEEGLRLISGY